MQRRTLFTTMLAMGLAMFAGAVPAQTSLVQPVAGVWRTDGVVLHVVDSANGHGPARVRVRYVDDGRVLPVRSARWDPTTRTLAFLLPGHGPRGGRDHTDATVVELVLSMDGQRLQGRTVGMVMRPLTFERSDAARDPVRH